VRRVNGVSRDTVPLRIIPDRAELAEHLLQSARAKDRTILNEDKPWPKIGDEAEHLTPKATFGSVRSSHSPGEADVLAGEAANDDINGNSVCAQSFSGETQDIFIVGCLRPMLSQHAPAERVDLAERDSLEPASALQAEVESADSCKKR
jgi:hypothetical protein